MLMLLYPEILWRVKNVAGFMPSASQRSSADSEDTHS